MINNIDIANVLFLDIETASQRAEFKDLEENFQDLWRQKSSRMLSAKDAPAEDSEFADLYKNRAAIYSEFGKIICISVGIVVRDKNQKLSLRLKSFADEDESKILRDFAALLGQYYKNPERQFLCGHNIKEFDVPYMCRRMVVHQIPLPAMLQLHGKKPWETKHLLDTLELWKFGDAKSYTSLKLLAAVLGFPSPKDDIDGSEVGNVYWLENDLERISIYCEKDVLATVQLLLKFMYMPLLEPEQITYVDRKIEEE